MKEVIPFAKDALAPLWLTAAASVINAEIEKKIHDSGGPLSTTSIILKKEKSGIKRVVQVLEDSNILFEKIKEDVSPFCWIL